MYQIDENERGVAKAGGYVCQQDISILDLRLAAFGINRNPVAALHEVTLPEHAPTIAKPLGEIMFAVTSFRTMCLQQPIIYSHRSHNSVIL